MYALASPFSIPGLDAHVNDIRPFAPANLAGIAGGTCWLIVYLLAIWYGFKYKSFAIPQYVIPLNLGWETLTSFVLPNPIPAWMLVNRGWLALDLVIVSQLLRYGRKQQTIPQIFRLFFPILIGEYLLGMFGQWGYIDTYRDALGYEVAFVIDLVMSVLFLFQFFDRRDASNLAYAIGWFKLFGNVGVVVQCIFLFPEIHPFVRSFAFYHFLYVAILLFDLLYLVLLWYARRALAAGGASVAVQPAASTAASSPSA
jgi:hypothetical protein